jgi:hypothetical protein
MTIGSLEHHSVMQELLMEADAEAGGGRWRVAAG